MTYSIVAVDPDTGDLGIAAQSHFFGVGRLATWSESGVGAIATQAFVNVDFGPDGLAKLRAGVTPGEALDELLEEDDLREYRQLAVVDAAGRTASHTGALCVPASGGLRDDGVAVQGNMLASDAVYEAMLDAYQRAEGTLADRMLAGMTAAERQGGDVRGSQSAVMKVVSGTVSERPWQEVLLDVRVDDHHDPITELARLLPLHRAFDQLGTVMFAPRLMMGTYTGVSRDELESALDSLSRAREVLGDNLEAAFWQAVLLARAGRTEEAKALFVEIFARRERLRDFLTAISTVGFLDGASEFLS
ncbi:Uncharacterized conserved protein, Ntn-hydrolase superfamily [Haloechinothrix alba]|uniref:Uncharacterized conserved protein, Ntn-hydrolase superfamily n=1 Tax=Haloechinothrix alba TaxID=664784 RepID=A0A238ZZM5_9PSEU|nr:DUF1028 domain-containing protein [Haloechinothrix alba]SNR88847.1 Uncharacterized conserved protein, Ntn-hydrolase superfamily [Haloechinothrix alba]